MKTLEELKKEFGHEVYSLFFGRSVVDGVRVIHEDVLPIHEIGELFERAIKEAREETLKEAIALVQIHTEQDGSYCDTGEDMDWHCRSDCTKMAIDRLKKLSQQKP